MFVIKEIISAAPSMPTGNQGERKHWIHIKVGISGNDMFDKIVQVLDANGAIEPYVFNESDTWTEVNAKKTAHANAYLAVLNS